MDGISRSSRSGRLRSSSTQESSTSRQTGLDSRRTDSTSPEPTRRGTSSRSSFEAGSSLRAFSQGSVRQPPPPPPPDASHGERVNAAQQWVDYSEQFRGNAQAELDRKRSTVLPDASANQLMQGGTSSGVYVAGRSTVGGNENIPAFFQDFPSSDPAERQMQLYTFCRPPEGQQLNPSDRNQWVSFEVYGSICDAYSDEGFTNGKAGTNSVLGFPDSGREDAVKTGAPFLGDSQVQEFRAAQRAAGQPDVVSFQKFQNGYLVDLGGKVQAYSLDGQRLGTSWPGGSMGAQATEEPRPPLRPTGPYGDYGPLPGDTSFGNAVVQLGTSNRFGGAIDSLVYDGKQYINNTDHGRQMQVAYSLDGYNEAYMPTEAGNNRDGHGPTSTSQLVGVDVQPGSSSTTVHPAYWLEPGERAGDYNGEHATVAHNTTEVAPDTMTKRVTAGVGGHDNVIRYDSHIHLAGEHDKIYVEAPTTYLTHEFERHFRFDPATRELREYERVRSETPGPNGFQDEAGNVPLIVSTPDGKHAMAIWSPDEGRGDLQYRLHQFDFSDQDWTGGSKEHNSTKLGVTFGMNGNVPQDIRTTTYVIVGTVEEVQERLAELYAQNPTGVRRQWPPDEGRI